LRLADEENTFLLGELLEGPGSDIVLAPALGGRQQEDALVLDEGFNRVAEGVGDGGKQDEEANM